VAHTDFGPPTVIVAMVARIRPRQRTDWQHVVCSAAGLPDSRPGVTSIARPSLRLTPGSGCL